MSNFLWLIVASHQTPVRLTSLLCVSPAFCAGTTKQQVLHSHHESATPVSPEPTTLDRPQNVTSVQVDPAVSRFATLTSAFASQTCPNQNVIFNNKYNIYFSVETCSIWDTGPQTRPLQIHNPEGVDHLYRPKRGPKTTQGVKIVQRPHERNPKMFIIPTLQTDFEVRKVACGQKCQGSRF